MEYIFGDNRPIANAKVMYQLEFKDKDIAETSDVDNKILYIGPKGDLGTYIKIMRKSGDKLWEKDLEHNTLTFKIVLYKSKGY
ncbi:hypothetical protein [Priestia aryabhattai]|uniref:Uncharacterized protein n=1 Tax=Priestia aryabhattai TaxID=412384 RepID=A0ABD7X2N9_PRIAR|nr:hypothetical protein [Priestia aryabhattai]WEA46729.1 hypothetical protein PWO00_12430 [Priestia aryabhattai]